MNITLETLVEKHKVMPKFVIDVGGYKGDYAHIINEKYGCDIIIYEPIQKYYEEICRRFEGLDNIKVVPVGIGKDIRIRKMYVSDASTSFFQGWNKSSKIELVSTVCLSEEIKGSDRTVDILKLNCEGAEYEILDDLSRNDLIKDIKEILVQFHKIQGRQKYEELLSKTHEKVFDFKWQLWIKR